MGTCWSDGYSSDVEIYLLVGDERLRVSNVGRNSLVLWDCREIPAGTEADLVITIDGEEEVEHVILTQGAIGGPVPIPFF